MSSHQFTRPGQVAPDRPAADACMVCGQPEATHNPAARPFETEQQVRELPSVRAVYDAFSRDPGPGKMAPHNHRMLCEALSAAGVELGAYDHRIVSWLATWEPQTVAVIAGWVQRAASRPGPGRGLALVELSRADLALILDALTDTRNALDPEGGRDCADCAAQAGQCQRHRDDRRRAAECNSLHARLAGA